MAQLKRYTELPFVLQLLHSKKLTLINPSAWDDKNDSHFVQAYRDRKGLGSVLALCLTEAQQTYHHWKVFTHGASGACICFDKKAFQKWIGETDLLEGREVVYRTLPEIQKRPPKLKDLPFLKRKAYEHEGEFRLLYSTKKKSVVVKSFDLSLEIIDFILLNPWLPPSTAKAIEEVIHCIEGCERLEVKRATIVKNDAWQNTAEAATDA
ncbi:MAG: hypothetical protein QM808_11560 [Steroidobacteraceae bacterium]